MQNIFKCIFIIIGTIIGAGFASGQEIANFFNRFGQNGIYGVIISGVLFGIVTILVLDIIDRKNIYSYDDLVEKNKIVKTIIQLFLFICFCIMIAGVGAFFREQLNVSFWLGSIFAANICYLIFLHSFRGLEIINTYLVPLLIIGIIIIGVSKYDPKAIIEVRYVPPGSFTNSFLMSSILYTSYNSILLVPVLITFKKYKFNKTEKNIIGISIAICLSILGILLYNIINIFYPHIMLAELPALKIANLLGIWMKYYYSLVILFAIFTTAASTGYSLLEINNQNNEKAALFLCALSVVLSKLGFSELINTFFPLFGYLGILQIFYVLKKYIK